MSETQYLIDLSRNGVKAILDAGQINRQNPPVYQALINNLFNPQGSQFLTHLINHVEQSTQGRWRQGIDQNALLGILKPWTLSALQTIERLLYEQQNQRPAMGFTPQPVFGGSPAGFGGFQPNYTVNPTAGMYDAGGRTPGGQPAQVQFPELNLIPPGNVPLGPVVDINPDYQQGSPVVLDLHKASNAEIQQPSGGVLSVANYCTGEHEKTRVLTSEITLRVAQNTAEAAGKLVFLNAPQEVIRGQFANVILFHELFCLPVAYQEFVIVADAMYTAYSKENNWRAALDVLNSRTRDVWKFMDKALTRLLNAAISRRIRSSNDPSAMIMGIETIEDLSLMDDRTSDVVKVIRHTKYWSTFNKIVTQAIENLIDPENRVGPNDKNFGDFIHCEEIVFYADERSKYDYGTFDEKIDRQAFIQRMMAENTVIRVPRAAILTNALDSRLVARVKRLQPSEQLLVNTINTVGTSLISSLDYLKRGDADTILCLEPGNPRPYAQIHLGLTLDDDLLLLS